jgi:hypothetical protein
VFLSLGPGLRVSGKLKEWKEERLAVVQMDAMDGQYRDHPVAKKGCVKQNNILEVPV